MFIAINHCFGGFSLSAIACERIAHRKNLSHIGRYDFTDYEKRIDPDLIAVIRELGEAANGRYASLKLVEVPDDVLWEISDYDGIETVEEIHRSWC